MYTTDGIHPGNSDITERKFSKILKDKNFIVNWSNILRIGQKNFLSNGHLYMLEFSKNRFLYHIYGHFAKFLPKLVERNCPK